MLIHMLKKSLTQGQVSFTRARFELAVEVTGTNTPDKTFVVSKTAKAQAGPHLVKNLFNMWDQSST